MNKKFASQYPFCFLGERKLQFLLSLIILISCQSPNLESFLERELVPYPNDYLKVDPNQLDVQQEEKAFRYYDRGFFEESKAYLLSYRQLFTQNQDIDFYLANTYMAIGKFERAYEVFENITASGRYYPQAIWYKVLLLARTEKYEAATKMIDSYLLLSSYYDYKMDEAKQLQGLLKGLGKK